MKLVYQLGLACLLVSSLCSVASAQMLRTVALTNEFAPNTTGGINFSDFGKFVALNSAGQTAFRAGIAGNGVNDTNDFGIWSEGSGSLALVAREGDSASGLPGGVIFDSLFSSIPRLNSAGQTAFNGSLAGSGVHSGNDFGIWSEGSGSLALVARVGDPVLGATNETLSYGGFGNFFVLNSAGQMAFKAGLQGSGVSPFTSIWSEGFGSLTMVARSGDQAPDTPSGVIFRNFRDPLLNSAGQTAFMGFLAHTTGGANRTNDGGVWSEGSGSLALVAREGEPAPGTPSGVQFGNFDYQPAFNSAGQTAFLVGLTGNSVFFRTNDQGIWSEGTGSLELVARAGDQAPDTLSGVNFQAFSSPVLNSAGNTAFHADLTGSSVDQTNNEGIWSERSGSLTLVARKGQQALGTPVGVTYGGAVGFLSRSFGKIVLNSADQIAYSGSVIGNGINNTNDEGIWAVDRVGTLHLIAREGDLLEVSPGDSRTISSLSFGEFNDLGQLAFWAKFTNGTSGIFVSNLATLPEPNTLLLVATASVALALSRRR